MSGDVLVVIPARGGSKGVPGKNLARVGGVPLVVRAIRAAQMAQRVTAVAMSTDDPTIAAAATAAGAIAVERPPDLAGDEATSEAALSHAVALGDGVKRVYDGELQAMRKLRRVPGVVADSESGSEVA